MCQRANPDCQVRGWKPPLVAVGAWDGVRFCPCRFHPFCLLVDDWSQCWVTIMAVACICIPEMFASCRRTTAIWLQIRYECRFGDMILCSKVREAYEATQCLCAKGSWKLKVETEMLKCDEVFQYLPILQWNELLRASWRSAFVAKSVTSRQTWRSCWVGQAKQTWSPYVSIGLPVHGMPCPCPWWGDAARVRRIAKVEQVGKSIWKSQKKIFEKGIRPYGSMWVHIRYRPAMSVCDQSTQGFGSVWWHYYPGLAGRRFCCAQVSCDNCGLHLADADKPGHSLLDPDLYWIVNCSASTRLQYIFNLHYDFQQAFFCVWQEGDSSTTAGNAREAVEGRSPRPLCAAHVSSRP